MSVPNRYCDIVMKGGITSGVVYPLAIAELANEFRFKNIGGTSAGAIAAVVAGAAEYCRVEKGSDAGFEELKKLPGFLAGKTDDEPNLLNLFPPTRETRRLFNVALAFLGHGSKFAKSLRAIVLLFAVSPLIALASFLPALLLAGVMATQSSLRSIVALSVIELVLIFTGVVLMAIGNAVLALCSTLPRNRFGFSTGRAPSDRPLPGVTDWLHGEIQRTAGLAKENAPLTFGDLWQAGEDGKSSGGAMRRYEDDPSLRSINVQMITTALTHGHPYRLPFENRLFSFCEREFREYFPKDVVDHLIATSRVATAKRCPNGCGNDLYALPEPWDLPLVVAARMSLSFPLLFTLVPLYGVDYTRKANEETASPTFERCWFIDGGLSSNFPTSLFDSPLPRWPTFGINLDDFHPDYPQDPNNQSKNVWMVSGAGSGTSARWKQFPDRGAAGILGYITQLLDSIRNWHDNTQLAVPGFRDRIAHVKLTEDEGGLNLNMDAAKVTRLSQRGKWAATMLRQRFGIAGATHDGLNWNTHRWTRLRSSLGLFQNEMRRIRRALEFKDPAYPNFDELLARATDANPKTGYWWPAEGLNHAADEFMKAATEVAADAGLETGAPNPRPELRITPRL